jgi:WD40 repeat protein
LAIGGTFGVVLWDWSRDKSPSSLAIRPKPIPGGHPKIPVPITDVAFSGDGKVLVAVDARGILRQWDLTTGSAHSVFPIQLKILESDDVFHGMAFSFDGQVLAWSHKGGDISLHRRSTGKEFRRLKGHHGEIRVVRFFP